MKKFDDAPLPLFAWADVRPSAQIVDFAEVAPRLPRRVLSEISEAQRALWHLDRRLGLMAPTPVLPFSRSRQDLIDMTTTIDTTTDDLVHEATPA